MTKHWWIDTCERVAVTWVEAFLGTLMLDQTNMLTNMDWSMVRHAAVAGTIAAMAAVKAALASLRSGMSPASLVKAPPTN